MNSSSTSSSDKKRQAPASWKHIVAFCLGLVVLLCACQWLGGFRRNPSDKWFGQILSAPAPRPFDAIFIGSSRVAAAVDTHAFDSAVSSRLNRPFLSVNLGMGYSRMSEYFFALRHVIAVKPSALQGVDVFLEAPNGLPEFAKWSGNWIVGEGTEQLAMYMSPGDLPRFLMESTTPTFSKALITTRVLFGVRENISRLREIAFGSSLRFLDGSKSDREASSDGDLSSAGGIKTDSASILAVKKIAISMAKFDARDTSSMRGYGQTILKEVVDLVQKAGGTVHIFTMPLSDVQVAVLSTPQRIADRSAFESELSTWNVPLHKVSFPCTVEDFPDFWHLRKSRAPEFTRLLAEQFLQTVRIPASDSLGVASKSEPIKPPTTP